MAAANAYWQLEKEYYTIATDDQDLVVRIIEHDPVTRTEGDGDTVHTITESVASKVHEFKVNRERLMQSSSYFAEMLEDGKFKESEAGGVVDVMSEDPVTAVTVWFKIVHGVVDESAYAIGVDGVWYMLAAAETYGFETRSEAARAWFEKWYGLQSQGFNGHPRNLDYKEQQMMLLPTFRFECIEGFKAATKYLVYRATGHIMERRPLDFNHDDIKLDASILQQLNAAKSRLKTILHRNLYNPIDDLIRRARCRCKANVLYSYEQALTVTGSWPLETAFLSNSVERTLSQLQNFQMYGVQSCGGRFCTFDFQYVVSNARLECRRYFDGLCIDCMHKSQYNEEEFWRHAKPSVHWDDGCRTNHQQPSWYFSFLGPRHKMAEWVDSKRNPGQQRGNAAAQAHVTVASVTAGMAEMGVEGE